MLFNFTDIKINQPVVLFNNEFLPFSISTIQSFDEKHIVVLDLIFDLGYGTLLKKQKSEILHKWKPHFFTPTQKYPFFKDIISHIKPFNSLDLLDNETYLEYENRVFLNKIKKYSINNKEKKNLQEKLQKLDKSREAILHQINNISLL
jgi:hypothetical protein